MKGSRAQFINKAPVFPYIMHRNRGLLANTRQELSAAGTLDSVDGAECFQTRGPHGDLRRQALVHMSAARVRVRHLRAAAGGLCARAGPLCPSHEYTNPSGPPSICMVHAHTHTHSSFHNPHHYRPIMEAFKAPIRHFNCILSRCHFVYGEQRDPVVVMVVVVDGGGVGGSSRGHRPGVLSAAADDANAGSFDVALAQWL